MNKPNSIRILLIVVFAISSLVVYPQKTNVYTNAEADFRTGIELFQKEKYGAAQNHFNKIVASKENIASLTRIDAEYYSALCAIELFNKDGEYYLKQFIKNHPESPKVKAANFHLGRYNYRKNKYKDAIEWFDQVDIYELTEEELAEFYFKRGYSYFNEYKYDLASKDFYEIKDVENKYTSPAKYYYAHIAYINKNYESSLVNFMALQKDPTFGPVVSYYIVQLYHLQQKYDSVIAYAPGMLDTINSKREPEIARILGEAYYHSANYGASIPYFLRYEKFYHELSRSDNYQIGYAYYQIKDYASALMYFDKAGYREDDSLSQNIAYHMADCYLKTGEKRKALNGFKKASKAEQDVTIKEDALFNYAKLCYELSYNPYSDAIRGLKAYIKRYPGTSRSDEAYGYLVNAFITIKNYTEALDAIEHITNTTPDLKVVHQKVAYYSGIDYFNNMDYTAAIEAFNKSLKYNFDREIKAQAIYWKGEAYYRLKDYKKSIEVNKEYLNEPGAVGKVEREEANYNIGYGYFKLADYENSNLWFRKFVTFKTHANEKKINDAYNRIGDGYFMQRNFLEAEGYYAQAYKMKLVDADYALYQKALSEGLEKKLSAKIDDLQSFTKEYSQSSYIQKVKYELAETYLSDKQPDQALNQFLRFIDEYPSSIYTNTCLSKIGLIYRNRKEDDKALEYFDKLIKRDRKTLEANEAITIVKSIYQNKGEIEELQEYLSTIGESIPQASLDTITFETGKKHYMGLNCPRALDDLKKYIQKFPDGIFIVEAHYYKAKCEYNENKVDEALGSFKFIAGRKKNQYTEEALYRVATILYQKHDYANALIYFEQLDQMAENSKNREYAIINIMRCNYRLKNYTPTIESSNVVLGLDKLTKEQIYEAHYNIAHSYFAIDSIDDALAEFKVVANSTKNDLGAEASYYVALIQHQKGEYKEAEKTIYELINSEANSPYWITNSLLVLADNYIALKDHFQAKTILNSVLSDSDIPELIKKAQGKLDKIKAEEEAAKQLKPDTEMIQLLFDGDSLEQKKLFLIEPVEMRPSEE